MKKKTLNTKQGFTIIEVVLVLAIAGLIFLMVFLAFPALQRNQRDTQRRQDYANLSAAVISTATNNNGEFPADGSIDGKALNKDGADPQGNAYSITISKGTSAITLPTGNNFALGRVYVYQYAQCVNGSPVRSRSDYSAKQFAIYAPLEDGGKYCLNGQI